MQIDYETANSFLKPCEVIQNLAPTITHRDAMASITRRHNAYKTLREVEYGLLAVGDISVRLGEISFPVMATHLYDEFIEAVMENDLVWSARRQSINYRETISRWKLALEFYSIPKLRVERMRRNDLTNPAFGDFGIILMEFLVSCTERGGNYVKLEGWTAML